MNLLKSEKVDWTNISKDYKKMQQLSGLIASSGMILSIFVIMTANVSSENIKNIWLIAGLLGLFIIVYYLFPSIYLNKKLQFLPDVVFVLGISSAMLNLGKEGDFFFIFLLVILAVNAFSLTNWQYVFSFSVIFLALVVVYGTEGRLSLGGVERDVLMQFYGVLCFGFMLRLFASENISLRQKQEELFSKTKELIVQKKEITNLINNISDGVVAVDNEKKITLINESSLKILGILGTYKHILGKNIDDIMPVSSADGTISLVDGALTGGGSSIRDDLRLVRTERTLRIHSNVAPVIESQKVQGAIILFRDITTKKEIEEQRAEFNAIASHELRTPLTVIEGYLYHILNDKSLKYDKKTEENLQKSYDAASNLLKLSNDILTVIRADENQIRLNIEEVDLKSTTKSVVDSLSKKAMEKKIDLKTKFPRSDVIITSDGTKIKEVLTNLVDNGIKFTSKGDVTVEIQTDNEKEVTIKVIDTGIGIKKEDQRMIFHKFYRAEDWQTRKTGGTGLGLYISKILVNRLGGDIKLESKKDKGSTFTIKLPKTVKRIRKKIRPQAELNEFIHSI